MPQKHSDWQAACFLLLPAQLLGPLWAIDRSSGPSNCSGLRSRRAPRARTSIRPCAACTPPTSGSAFAHPICPPGYAFSLTCRCLNSCNQTSVRVGPYILVWQYGAAVAYTRFRRARVHSVAAGTRLPVSTPTSCRRSSRWLPSCRARMGDETICF